MIRVFLRSYGFPIARMCIDVKRRKPYFISFPYLFLPRISNFISISTLKFYTLFISIRLEYVYKTIISPRNVTIERVSQRSGLNIEYRPFNPRVIERRGSLISALKNSRVTFEICRVALYFVARRNCGQTPSSGNIAFGRTDERTNGSDASNRDSARGH